VLGVSGGAFKTTFPTSTTQGPKTQVTQQGGTKNKQHSNIPPNNYNYNRRILHPVSPLIRLFILSLSFLHSFPVNAFTVNPFNHTTINASIVNPFNHNTTPKHPLSQDKMLPKFFTALKPTRAARNNNTPITPQLLPNNKTTTVKTHAYATKTQPPQNLPNLISSSSALNSSNLSTNLSIHPNSAPSIHTIATSEDGTPNSTAYANENPMPNFMQRRKSILALINNNATPKRVQNVFSGLRPANSSEDAYQIVWVSHPIRCAVSRVSRGLWRAGPA